jgi:hypothetical protein
MDQEGFQDQPMSVIVLLEAWLTMPAVPVSQPFVSQLPKSCSQLQTRTCFVAI